MATKEQVLAGRAAVGRYRANHSQLYSGGYYKKIHDDHTPLLNAMKTSFKAQGFNNLIEFFSASEEMNLEELGFTSRQNYDDEIARLNIGAEKYTETDKETGKTYEVTIDTPEAASLRALFEEKWR